MCWLLHGLFSVPCHWLLRWRRKSNEAAERSRRGVWCQARGSILSRLERRLHFDWLRIVKQKRSTSKLIFQAWSERESRTTSMKVDYCSFSILLCKQMKSIPKPMTRIIVCFENQQRFRSNVFDFNVKKVDTIILRSTCYNSTADPKATKSEKLFNQHRIVAMPVSWYQMVLLRKHKQTKTTKQFLPSFDFLFASASSTLQARPPFTPTRPLNNEKNLSNLDEFFMDLSRSTQTAPCWFRLYLKIQVHGHARPNEHMQSSKALAYTIFWFYCVDSVWYSWLSDCGARSDFMTRNRELRGS